MPAKLFFLYSETTSLVRRLIPNRSLRWVAVASLWTLVGVLSASHWSYFPMGDYPYSWWELYRVKIGLWLVWGAITPLILHFGFRFRLERPIKFGNVIMLVGLSLVTTVAYLMVYSWLLVLNISGNLYTPTYWDMFGFVISRHSTFYYLAFWALLGLEHAISYHRRSHDRALHASQLETMLAQAQLSALRSRLQPHFLFNSLHSVVALIRSKRQEEATAMVTRLSDLLRQTLVHMDQDEVSLEAELELLHRYIAIEKMRFSDRLSVSEEIAADTLSARVPSFLLQPLVENAIRHGIEQKIGPGRITIRSERIDRDRLRIAVLDDGPGPAADTNGNGVGLQATRERLARMYPESYDLTLQARDHGGTATIVTFPYADSVEED